MCERGFINTEVLEQEFKRVERCGRRGASVNVCPRVGAVKALMYVALFVLRPKACVQKVCVCACVCVCVSPEMASAALLIVSL